MEEELPPLATSSHNTSIGPESYSWGSDSYLGYRKSLKSSCRHIDQRQPDIVETERALEQRDGCLHCSALQSLDSLRPAINGVPSIATPPPGAVHTREIIPPPPGPKHHLHSSPNSIHIRPRAAATAADTVATAGRKSPSPEAVDPVSRANLDPPLCAARCADRACVPHSTTTTTLAVEDIPGAPGDRHRLPPRRP